MRAEAYDPATLTIIVSESFKRRCFRRPKFGKTLIVDLPSFLADELSDYLRFLKKEALKAGRGGVVDRLFSDPAEGGRWPYSQRKVQTLVRRVCQGAGLSVRNPHDLRHTYAVNCLCKWYVQGKDVNALLPVLSTAMGHVKVSCTQIYLHVPAQLRQEAAERFAHHVVTRIIPER